MKNCISIQSKFNENILFGLQLPVFVSDALVHGHWGACYGGGTLLVGCETGGTNNNCCRLILNRDFPRFINDVVG